MAQVYKEDFLRMVNLTAVVADECGNIMSEKDTLCMSSMQYFFYNHLHLEKQSTPKHNVKFDVSKAKMAR
jgi:hypothetical protein